MHEETKEPGTALMEQIGKTIKEFRSKSSVKYLELLQKANITGPTLYKIEDGKSVHLQNIAAVCEALGIDIMLVPTKKFKTKD